MTNLGGEEIWKAHAITHGWTIRDNCDGTYNLTKGDAIAYRVKSVAITAHAPDNFTSDSTSMVMQCIPKEKATHE